jgi:hypothetical protein
MLLRIKFRIFHRPVNTRFKFNPIFIYVLSSTVNDQLHSQNEYKQQQHDKINKWTTNKNKEK